MVPLRDDLDAENIRNGYTLPIRHLDHAVDRVDPFDRSGNSLVAQHYKSNKRLHKTFGWILVETADFKNRAIMLQWCLFVEREENYALYNGRGGCHLRFFERAFGAGRCGSVCAETKRRISARCHNGNAAAG